MRIHVEWDWTRPTTGTYADPPHSNARQLTQPTQPRSNADAVKCLLSSTSDTTAAGPASNLPALHTQGIWN